MVINLLCQPSRRRLTAPLEFPIVHKVSERSSYIYRPPDLWLRFFRFHPPTNSYSRGHFSYPTTHTLLVFTIITTLRMCRRRVVSHRSWCDVRTLDTSDQAVAVDGLLPPERCCCAQDPVIKPRFQCSYGHGCCYMAVTYHWCGTCSCPETLTEFHKYSPRNGTSWVEYRNSIFRFSEWIARHVLLNR